MPSRTSLLEQAANDAYTPLPQPLAERMRQRLGHDFGHVRVHAGPGSAATAELLGARAYTLGRDVHLGGEAQGLGSAEHEQLLAHEAIHTVQQGGSAARPSAGQAVSRPDDMAEREAHALAAQVGRPSSPWPSSSLALHHQAFGPATGCIQRSVAPQLQRNLKAKHTAIDGEFDVDLKTEGHAGATSGMSGTIKFLAGGSAPDAKSIRLLQVVRDEDLGTGKDYVWTGDEANRNKMMTSADTKAGVEAGYFVDHSAAAATPRTAKADAAVSPYYRDYWPNATKSQDGSKQGKTLKEASLWDFPGSGGKRRFSFETAAQSVDTGYVYATLRWGFTISDPANGTITNENAKAYDFPSGTFGAAVKSFNEFYKNPGASTAPSK